jgi:hypothetical protein
MAGLFLAIALSGMATNALAQDDIDNPVHWALAPFFGTGWYQLDQNRSVFIFRIPPRQTVRRSSIDASGKRTLGIEIKYPITFGLNRLDGLPDFIDVDNFGTVSFTPGVELEIPVTPRWYLRPNLHIGWGTETDSTNSAVISYGGVKSRFTPGSSKIDWSLLNAINFGGYWPDDDNAAYTGSFMTGFELRQPLPKFGRGEEPFYLDWHVKYTYLFDKLNFLVDEDTVESVKDEWEIGLALRRGKRPLHIWFIEFEHVGLAYRFSSNGKFQGIAINLRSPFTY